MWVLTGSGYPQIFSAPSGEAMRQTQNDLSPVNTSNNVEATLSKQQATLLPVASTLLLVWTGL